ncbi:UNVERIFIED_CONTAM: hypothetical protein FKN15_077265 [Acipenser sinensis]
MQSESSPHSPFAKRQSYQPSSSIMEAFMQQDKAVSASLPSATAPPSSPLSSKPSSSSAQQQMSPGSSDNQSSSPQPTQQHKLKQQKKRTNITTKIPALAVEMPGTSDIVGLNLQFGALQFGSEPALPEYESAPATSTPAGQTQKSLYTSAARMVLSRCRRRKLWKMAPTSSKQHAVNVNASAAPFQQASGYGSHAYSTGYEELSHGPGAGDFCKGGYSQSFDKQGFHTGTPATAFNLPSALGSGGPMNPGTAAGYPPAPFMHILAPHQQQHSQILHHHMQQDGQSGTAQRSQVSSIQQKSQLNKTAYNTYNWGAN